MSLQVLSQMDVYYGASSKRVVSLQSGDLSAVTTDDQITYLALSALPNDYSPTGNSLIQALYQKGISVKDMANDKLADHRQAYRCWIGKDVKNTAYKRIAVYEPSGKKEVYDYVNYVFSAIRKAQGSDTTPVCVALPLLSTGSAGADEIEMLERIFFAAVHFGAMQFPFSEIKIVLYHTKNSQETLKNKFIQLCDVYQNLEKIDLPASYGYQQYAKIASAYIGKKELPEPLTYRQAFGICMYTTGFYRAINGILRDRENHYTEYRSLLPLLEAIETGLMNLPVFQVKTYRGESGMTPERLAENAKGNTVCNLAYTSSSYTQGSYYTMNYRFAFTPLYGVLIKMLSYYPGENEVLFGQQMRYLVKDVQHTSFYQFYADEQNQELRR